MVERFGQPSRPNSLDVQSSTNVSEEEMEAWVVQVSEDLVEISAFVFFDGSEGEVRPGSRNYVKSAGGLEIRATLKDGRRQVKRSVMVTCEGYDSTLSTEYEWVLGYVTNYVTQLSERLQVQIPLMVTPLNGEVPNVV